MSTSSPEHAIDRLQDRLSRLPLRERKKLKTRRAIQDHALRLFTGQGYDETTVEQIAAAAEISPSTFFRYFPTKEDVVITDEFDPIMAEVFRSQPPGRSPIEALRETLREILPLMPEDDFDVIRTRMRLMAEVPALRARMFEVMRQGTHAVLSDLLAERTGRDRGDPEIEAFNWAVLGVLQAAMYQWLESASSAAELADLIDRNLEFLSRGCPL
ncbi:TetR family transcriptional regulator [Actinomadura darangshiensis]|uniref:TetR family transcriptional regulator n=1 Tax=Actinomadura darangshiensis TaxID=705336 RepID=A0A4R5BFA8_9ACTN|nr:TetR family transcriptional regulator [Actinomadura darangshiensis]TDD85248.1 TetR family transcriptional regulator [Actinomadura darangshiensis]